MTARRRHPRLTLFWRVYLYGVALLFTVAVTAALATHLGRSFGETPTKHLSLSIYSTQLAALMMNDPSGAATRDLIDEIHRLSRVTITVFDNHDRMVAAAGPLVQPHVTPEMVPRAGGHGFFIANAMPNVILPLTYRDTTLGYALISWKGSGHIRLGLLLAAVFLLLLVMPYIAARAITRPLARISRTAREIGAGHLAARTRLDRSDEIGQLAEEVDRMAARIEHLIQSEKTLMANISHEIRTPLARIRVVLELLEESAADLSSADREYLGDLQSDVTELETLLEDVFMTARLDITTGGAAGTVLSLNRTHLDLPELAGDVTGRFEKHHPGIPVTTEFDPGIPPVFCDPALIRRLLLNLLDNAGKYGGPNPEITLRISRRGFRVVMAVSDRGPGIPEDQMGLIFEAFYRGSPPARAEALSGVGLGLTLCRRIADAHGGRIDAENRREGGAVFTVELPIDPAMTHSGDTAG